MNTTDQRTLITRLYPTSRGLPTVQIQVRLIGEYFLLGWGTPLSVNTTQ